MSEAPRPVVSVCIANYNGEHPLESHIASVLAHKNAPAFEIIVHDDFSADDSFAMLKRYPDVHVIAFPNNGGFFIANNRMAAAAKGAFLLLLNIDARLLRDTLSTLFSASAEWSHRAALSLSEYTHEGRLVDRGFPAGPVHEPRADQGASLRRARDAAGPVSVNALGVVASAWRLSRVFRHGS